MMRDAEAGYQPISWGLRQKLAPLCLADQLFCVLYAPLADAEAETGLSPEEVWCEALAVSARLGRTPRPDIALRLEQGFLARRYAALPHPGGAQCAVLTVLLFMLADVPAEARGGTHAALCRHVARQLNGHPLHEGLCASISRSEEDEEAEGRPVPERDYLHESAPPSALQPGAADTLPVADLVDEALATCSAGQCEAVLAVLARYDYHHAHAIEPHVGRLRQGLDELRRRATEAREINNHGTYIEQVGTQHLSLPPAPTHKLIDNKTA